MKTTATTETENPMSTTTLADLRHVLENLDFEEVGPGIERTDALRAVAALEAVWAEVKDWHACLRCGAAFPTDEQHSRHYWRAHRGL